MLDGASAVPKSGNYFGPLAGAKGSLCQQGTDIECIFIWFNKPTNFASVYVVKARRRKPCEKKCIGIPTLTSSNYC
jgi:hypothetical protein